MRLHVVIALLSLSAHDAFVVWPHRIPALAPLQQRRFTSRAAAKAPRSPVEAPQAPLAMSALLPLATSAHLSAVMASRNFNTATPIQCAAFESVHQGQSLTLHSETGSGKVGIHVTDAR